MERQPVQWAWRRTVQLVEDVIRTYPEGAPRDVVLQRLLRVGVTPEESQAVLAALLERRRITLAGGRFLLANA